jgi:hypothetical protein
VPVTVTTTWQEFRKKEDHPIQAYILLKDSLTAPSLFPKEWDPSQRSVELFLERRPSQAIRL